jgi:tetratricopeptide (TPR) repeat protein
VLTEEALILLAALGALGLVVLGTLELLWPSRPKHPVRRASTPSPPVQVVSPEAQPGERAPAAGRRWRSRHPRHAASNRERYLKRPQPAEMPEGAAAHLLFTFTSWFRSAEPAQATPRSAPSAPAVEPVIAAPVEPAVAAVAESAIAADVEPVAGPDIEPVVESIVERVAEPTGVRIEASTTEQAIVDRCFELYQHHRYTDVVALAAGALGSGAPPARRPADAHQAAALWSILALAQQALGDHAAAHRALEAAIETAPEGERAMYRCQLATLALGVARNLVAAASAHGAPDSDSRVSELRDALAWLERGRAVAPDDSELRELAATAETRLWPAYEQVVMALVQRQEFGAARRLLREALAHPRVPAARAETFHELFSGTFSGEIGQLTAQAIRSMQEARETEALGALERAERLLESVHHEALPPKRREEVDRRLWWGYNKLGRRRVEAGAFEDAIEPLLRALRLAGTAPDRQSDTRAALVQAFEGWTEASALAIREVADAGDREAAIVRSDRLWTRLRAALTEGLSERELVGAFTRVRRLFEEIGRERQ